MSDIVRIGIIGTGSVGTSVAVSTLHAGIARELLLHDVRAHIAEGEAMDLAHGATFYPAAIVRPVTIDEMLAADAVVIAAGRGGRPNESRLDLLKDNAAIVRNIARGLRDYAGLMVLVTNPVDVLTHEATLASGLPPERVIGTGTMLDTARLRHTIGHTLHVAPQSVHAQVIGEHGDSEIVLWSSARAGGIPLREWPAWTADVEHRASHEVRTAAYEIIRRKGATNHAIGLVTTALLRAALRNEQRILTVSRVQTGVLGLSDVALSLPTIVGRGGAIRVVTPDLDEDERERLQQSAAVLRQSIGTLGATADRV